MDDLSEKLAICRAPRMVPEFKGVIVKVEKHSFTVSVVSPTVGLDAFEVKVENDGKALKLGSWVILWITQQNIYKIDRQCDEVLPTKIHKDLVLLQTPIYFQDKGQQGYGKWVWSPALGRIAALCHDRYNSKKAYTALVARTAGKYQAAVEYHWMLTKYIGDPNSKTPFNNCPSSSDDGSNGDGVSDSSGSLLESFSSGSTHLGKQLINQGVNFSNGDLELDDSNAYNIEFFHGVVTVLSNNFVVVGPKGHIGFLKHRQCDNSSKSLEIGNWVAVAAIPRCETAQYDVLHLPSLIKADVQTRVKGDIVMLLSTIKIEDRNENMFCGSSPIFGKVVGDVVLAKGKNEFIAWCVPRVSSNFNLYWEAVEVMDSSHRVLSEHKSNDGRKVRFNKEHKIHYIDGDSGAGSSVDDQYLPQDNLEEEHDIFSSGRNREAGETSKENGSGIYSSCERGRSYLPSEPQNSNANIYEVIANVVSNPNVRTAMKNYRPMELMNIDKLIASRFRRLNGVSADWNKNIK